MSLTTNLQSAVENMFNTPMASIVVTRTFTQKTRGANDFDPSTGAYAPSSSVTDTLRGIVVGVDKKDIEMFSAQPESKKMICIKSEVDALDFRPEIDDTVSIGSIDHKIYGEKIDPADVTICFYLKAAS